MKKTVKHSKDNSKTSFEFENEFECEKHTTAIHDALNRQSNPDVNRTTETRHERLARRYGNPIGRVRKTDILYTLHPPKGEFMQEEIGKTPAYVSNSIKMDIDDLFSGTVCSLEVNESGFENPEHKAKKPIFAIEAFLISHEAGLYPPMWVLKYMSDILSDWYDSQGTKSLDELFNLKCSKGQNPIFKRDFENRRDESLCLTVFGLKLLYGYTIEEACYMAQRRLEESPDWNKTKFDLKEISADTIRDKYNRKWGKIFNHESMSFIREQILSWDRDRKIKFLDEFPKDSFPTRRGKGLNDLIEKLNG